MSEFGKTVRYPTFEGDRKKFPEFKSKFESAMFQDGLMPLMLYKEEIPKDSKTFTEEELKDADKKLSYKIQKMNMKAMACLINAISTKKSSGQVAYAMVDAFKDADAGYMGGHFLNAWAALCAMYEEHKKVVPLAALKEEYYAFKMKMNDVPRVFLTNLTKRRKKCKEAGYEVTDAEWINEILSKLPPNKSQSELNPWQQTKMMVEASIKSKLERNPPEEYTVAMLLAELEKTYRMLHPVRVDEDEDDIGGPEEPDDHDKALAGFGQKKKACRFCGSWSHMWMNCPNKNKNKSYQNNRNRPDNRGSGNRSDSGNRGGNGGNRGNFRSGGSSGRNNRGGRHGRTNHSNKGYRFPGNCHICGRKGHKAVDCTRAKQSSDTGEIAFTTMEDFPDSSIPCAWIDTGANSIFNQGYDGEESESSDDSDDSSVWNNLPPLIPRDLHDSSSDECSAPPLDPDDSSSDSSVGGEPLYDSDTTADDMPCLVAREHVMPVPQRVLYDSDTTADDMPCLDARETVDSSDEEGMPVHKMASVPGGGCFWK